MQKVAFISLFVPTPENRGGASALPYHLLKFRPAGTKVRLYCFNINNIPADDVRRIESELALSITLLPARRRLLPGSLMRLLKPRPLLSYQRLPGEVRKEIDGWADSLCIYGEEIAGLRALFPAKPCTVLPPDCEALYYARVLSLPSKLPTSKSVLRYGTAYTKYLNLARRNPSDALTRYCFVGREDADFFRAMHPEARVEFLRHPHYEPGTEQGGSFDGEKVRLLIPGRYDFYSREAADEACAALCADTALPALCSVTFLGKGWEQWAEKMRRAGYEAAVIPFAPVYADELARHDLALFPITTGTGTKGKVLDAFLAGLMVVGTKRALENIAAPRGAACVEYGYGTELSSILAAAARDRGASRAMAEAGRRAVLTAHSREGAAARLFTPGSTQEA